MQKYVKIVKIYCNYGVGVVLYRQDKERNCKGRKVRGYDKRRS